MGGTAAPRFPFTDTTTSTTTQFVDLPDGLINDSMGDRRGGGRFAAAAPAKAPTTALQGRAPTYSYDYEYRSTVREEYRLRVSDGDSHYEERGRVDTVREAAFHGGGGGRGGAYGAVRESGRVEAVQEATHYGRDDAAAQLDDDDQFDGSDDEGGQLVDGSDDEGGQLVDGSDGEGGQLVDTGEGVSPDSVEDDLPGDDDHDGACESGDDYCAGDDDDYYAGDDDYFDDDRLIV